MLFDFLQVGVVINEALREVVPGFLPRKLQHVGQYLAEVDMEEQKHRYPERVHSVSAAREKQTHAAKIALDVDRGRLLPQIRCATWRTNSHLHLPVLRQPVIQCLVERGLLSANDKVPEEL